MKKIISISFILFLFAGINQSQAQEKKYLFDGDVSFSGFGGPIVDLGIYGDDFAAAFGGGGGVLINQKLFFGGMGQNVNLKKDVQIGNQIFSKQNIDMGFGGFMFGYNINPDKMVHLGISTIIGGGSLNFDSNEPNLRDLDSGFFLLQPQINLGINIMPWMKFQLSGTYRITSDVDLGTLQSEDINGPSASFGLFFGGF